MTDQTERLNRERENSIAWTQERVKRFIGLVIIKHFSREQAQSWLDALQCMDENQSSRLGAQLLIDDLHRVCLQWSDQTAHDTLWQYAGERIKIRAALCDAYQLPAARLL